jgi:hypothetical protein
MPTKNTRPLLTACGALLLGLSLSQGAAAQAVTLNFNELGVKPLGAHMPDTYGDISWKGSNWHYMTDATAPGDTYLALTGSATAVIRAGHAPFFFDGADFWSRRGLDANGNFYFVLSLKGQVVYNGVTAKNGKVRFDGTHRTLTPPYTGPVDTVAIAFAKPGKGGDWDQLAMDNFRFRPAP